MSNFNAPASIAETVISKVGVGKCKLTMGQTIVLGILAGAFIAFGAQLATRVMTGIEPFGLRVFMGGAVFSVGLMLVVIAGAELFTGNNLIMMSVLAKQTTVGKMIKYWVIVWIANFIGSILIVLFMHYSGLVSGEIAKTAGSIAQAKANLDTLPLIFRAIMCNWLVCLAVWLALASQDIIGKIFGIFFPIMAFVASGFEHSIANMYFIPMGMLVNPEITFAGAAHNIIWATVGNIIGGAGFVATIYWYTYHKCTTNK